MFKPSAILKRHYDRYNQLFFDGELPSDTIIGYNDDFSDKACCWELIVQHSDDEANHTVNVIYISSELPGIDKNFVEMQVIHAMAHLKLFPYTKHGTKYQNEMRRLAVRGAFDGLW